MPEIQTLIDVNNGKVVLHEEVLEGLCRQIGNHNVAIISTAGKFRQGKTFWNNVLLKGLRTGKAHFNEEEIIGGSDAFSFKCGQDRHTKGIMVYPEVFIRKGADGNELAVILIDTQGTYDMQSAMQDSSIIFALSLLLSSRKVFNAFKNISAADLDSLSVFIAFSQMDGYDRDKVGQDFMILLRDAFGEVTGLEGGKTYFEELKEKAKESQQLNNFMESITNSFDRVDCFTVPPPKRKVMNATGELKAAECGPKFLESLCACANFILDTISPKMIGKDPLTGKSLKTYVKHLVEHCKKGELKGMCSAYEAQSRLWFNIAFQDGMQIFEAGCDKLSRNAINDENLLGPDAYFEALDSYQKQAINHYNSSQRFGKAEIKKLEFNAFRKALREKFNEKMSNYKVRYHEKVFTKVLVGGIEVYEAGMKTNVTDLLNEEKSGIDSFGNLQARHLKALTKALDYYLNETMDIIDSDLVPVKRRQLEAKIEERFATIEQETATRSFIKSRNRIADETRNRHRAILEKDPSKVSTDLERDNLIDEAGIEARKYFAKAKTELIEKLCNAFKCLTAEKLRTLFEDYYANTINSMIESNITSFKSQCHSNFLLIKMNSLMKKLGEDGEDSNRKRAKANEQMGEKEKDLLAELAKFREQNDLEAKERAKRNDAFKKLEKELEDNNTETQALRREVERLKNELKQSQKKSRPELKNIATDSTILVRSGKGDAALGDAKKTLHQGLDETDNLEELSEFIAHQMNRKTGDHWACVAGFNQQASSKANDHIELEIDSLSVQLFRYLLNK